MDTSHAWHSRAVCLAPGWAAPIDLLPDELLSSWLTRIALGNGCDPLALTGALWPTRRAWSTDIDRFLPASCQATLAKMAGVSVAAVSGAMLRDVARSVGPMDPPLHGRWPWILSVRARNRKRMGGLQYCPRCLAADRRPYFRLQWRFAWHVACETHGHLLLDCCPHCYAPLEPHRLMAEHGHQAICASCGGVLTDVGALSRVDDSVAGLQAKTDVVLTAGSIDYLGTRIGVREWFAVLNTWLNLARLAARGPSEAAVRLLSVFGIARLPYPLEKAWESYETAARAAMLEAIARIVVLDAERLASTLIEAGLTRQCVFPHGVPAIAGMRALASVLPDRSLGAQRQRRAAQNPPEPRSRREVERRMSRLRAIVERMKGIGT